MASGALLGSLPKVSQAVTLRNCYSHPKKYSHQIGLGLVVRNNQQTASHWKWKSTSATAVSRELPGRATSENQQDESPKDPLDLTFNSFKDAFKSKTTWELLRALTVLKLSSFDYLVENHQMLMKFGKKVMGPKLFRLTMKHTFYGQFVAGEDAETIKPTIDRLRSFGVKAILDYSAEEDLSEEQATKVEMTAVTSSAPSDDVVIPAEVKQYKPSKEFADRRKHHVTARTYFYLSEAQCEKNMEIFLKSIDAVAGSTKHTGFAAIKMTALGRPQLLMQLSEVIYRTRKYFKDVTGAQNYMALTDVQPSTLETKLQIDPSQAQTDKEEFKKWMGRMDYDRKGLMNLFSWSGLVDMNYVISDLFKVPNLKTGRMERIISALTEEEEEMFRNMMRRLHHIAKTAREKDVRVMVDAEQTYFQPAINRLVLELMRKYNKEKAIIFNTYQCYLKEAYNNAVLDLELAQRQGFYFGAKLVRGAYMEQERLRAADVGYEDPINVDYEATSNMYHKTLSFFLDHIQEMKEAGDDRKIAIMVASHNEDTVRFTINKMNELNLRPVDKVVCFGQLLGMCDHVSFPLGQGGYSVYKYVPYGPIDEVLPYLSRRAQENHGLLKKMQRERGLLYSEVKRRLLASELFYEPKGNYSPI